MLRDGTQACVCRERRRRSGEYGEGRDGTTGGDLRQRPHSLWSLARQAVFAGRRGQTAPHSALPPSPTSCCLHAFPRPPTAIDSQLKTSDLASMDEQF